MSLLMAHLCRADRVRVRYREHVCRAWSMAGAAVDDPRATWPLTSLPRQPSAEPHLIRVPGVEYYT